MTDDEESPAWLTEALDGTADTTPYPAAQDVEWPISVDPGDIRVAQAMDQAGAESRLVLLLERYEEPIPWVNALMLSNVVEVATDRDVLLTKPDTGLSFSVLAETDVVGPLYFVQLGPRIGHVDHLLLGDLAGAVRGLETTRPPAGLPVSGKRDPRWRVKEGEVAAIQALSGDVFADLLDDDPQLPEVFVLDPSLVIQPGHQAGGQVESLLRAVDVQRRHQAVVDVPPEVLTEHGHLREWLSRLDPDQWSAIEPLLQQALAAAESGEEPLPEGPARWLPAREPGALGVHARRRAAAGHRSFRLLTHRTHWQEELDVDGPLVAAIDVQGFGRLQLPIMMLEDVA
jgi:hypothetical protein